MVNIGFRGQAAIAVPTWDRIKQDGIGASATSRYEAEVALEMVRVRRSRNSARELLF